MSKERFPGSPSAAEGREFHLGAELSECQRPGWLSSGKAAGTKTGPQAGTPSARCGCQAHQLSVELWCAHSGGEGPGTEEQPRVRPAWSWSCQGPVAVLRQELPVQAMGAKAGWALGSHGKVTVLGSEGALNHRPWGRGLWSNLCSKG